MYRTPRVKYYGGYSANNGTTFASNYPFTNLTDAKKTLKEVAIGNCYLGQNWSVKIVDVNDIEVYSENKRRIK